MNSRKRESIGKKKKPKTDSAAENKIYVLNIDALNAPMPASYISRDKKRRQQDGR